MRQLRCFGDERNKGFCVHCGGPSETVDHIPSRVLLDEPFPANLMGSPSCLRCNQDASLDEEYLACLLECAISGSTDPESLQRTKIARILQTKHALRAKLQLAKTEGPDGPLWAPEASRVRRVVLKLARCHAAYELNEPQLQEPSRFEFKPLAVMAPDERADFECPEAQLSVWPEVGSRAMQRALEPSSDEFAERWIVVQEGNYRYLTFQDVGLAVRVVLREYLACEVVWE